MGGHGRRERPGGVKVNSKTESTAKALEKQNRMKKEQLRRKSSTPNGQTARTPRPKQFQMTKPAVTPKPQKAIRTCPWCAETIKAAAIICRFCNRDVGPVALYGHPCEQDPESSGLLWAEANKTITSWPKHPLPPSFPSCCLESGNIRRPRRSPGRRAPTSKHQTQVDVLIRGVDVKGERVAALVEVKFTEEFGVFRAYDSGENDNQAACHTSGLYGGKSKGSFQLRNHGEGRRHYDMCLSDQPVGLPYGVRATTEAVLSGDS